MDLYVVGDYIREVRIRKGYTQEEVSFGICTPASLSRIENGTQSPSKRKLDKILERLGVENNGFSNFVNREELELYENIQALSRSISDPSKIDEIEQQIQALESRANCDTELEKQYILWAKAIVLRRRGEKSSVVMNMLMDAIHITLPMFDGKLPLENNLLTYDEILIINGIAIQHSRDGRFSDALRLGFWLKRYMEEKVLDGRMKTTKYPAIVYDLSNWLGKVERFKDALEVANIGIDYCVQFGNLELLPFLVFNKACALAEMENREEAKIYFTQSIVIFEAVKKFDKAKMANDWCKNKYQIII